MASHYGLIIQGKEKKQVPLKSVAVSGRIKGYVYGLETKLTYLNWTDDPLEVMFRFPIDESSAVVGLEAKINGKTIKGEIREKEEARQMYDDALSSGLSAALGEEKTKDIFSLALGNLPPKGEAEIVLKLCGEMPVDKESEAARFSLPTVLKPRYTPEGSTNPLAAIGGEGSQVVKGSAPAVSSFNIIVDRADGVSSITSPTHDISTSPKDGCTDVSLTKEGTLDKDLVILVQYKEPHTPRTLVEKGKEEKGNELMSNPAVMLEFFPKFTSPQAACEFLFVVDRSGSMQGAYINSAKETLVLFLKSIPPGCYFNIIGFGSSFEHLFPTSVPYNQTNLDKAMKHAQSLSANLGGTELLRPLQYAFEQKTIPGLPRQVFVLTDGSVSNTSNCINLTKKNVHTARVFTFGIGSGASTALVKGLARAGNGSAEFIKEGERLQGKVISSLKKALQPSITDVGLKYSVPNGIEVLQAPNKIPPVFNGEKIVLYGWLKGAGNDKSGKCSAVLTGKMLGSDIKHEIDFQLQDGSLSSGMPIVHQLAAKSLIQDWESAEKDMKKAAIIKLSTESSVVSSYTAYIAVDEDQDKPIEGAIKTYDLTADTVPSFLSGASQPRLYGGGGGGRGGGMKMRSCCCCSARCCAGSMPPPAMKKKCKKSAALQKRERKGMPMMMEPDYSEMCASMQSSDSDDDEEDDMVTDLLSASPRNTKDTSAASGLSRLITLQSAEGCWSLNDSLASIMCRSLSVLKSSCPNGVSEVVWGTVLALVLLETKYSSQRDEWELLSMKSEMWVQGQVLPNGITVASLTEQAKKCLAYKPSGL